MIQYNLNFILIEEEKNGFFESVNEWINRR